MDIKTDGLQICISAHILELRISDSSDDQSTKTIYKMIMTSPEQKSQDKNGFSNIE